MDLSRVSLLSILKISPQATALPSSRLQPLRGTGLVLGTGPSTGRAVSRIIWGSKLSPSRTLIFRLAFWSARASSYSSISRSTASRRFFSSWWWTCSTKEASPSFTASFPSKATAQSTPNQSRIRADIFPAVSRAASSS